MIFCWYDVLLTFVVDLKRSISIGTQLAVQFIEHNIQCIFREYNLYCHDLNAHNML